VANNHTLKLTDVEELERTTQLVKEHLPLKADGYICTTEDLINILLGVAANCGTVQALGTDLVGSPDPETIRGYLREQLRVEDLPELEQRLNAALVKEIPDRVWRQACDVALDFHDRPYYGKTSQTEGLWVRTQAKDGTTHFYRIATAYVMLHDLRVTLAIHFVLPEDETVKTVEILLHQVKKGQIRIKRLLLDKGFGGIAVMTYLTRQGLSAVIACTIRGKTGGTRALCQGRKSYCTTHTFHGEGGLTFTANLVVCRAFTTAKRTKRLKPRLVWLVYILINLDLAPKAVRRLYRKRFGIETSYRCSGQVRGWTTSNNPAYRFVLMALTFVLLNVWIHLRWLFTQVPRRGRRWLDTERFELTRLAKFIRRALEDRYGCVREIVALVAPRL
jgi:putative transposase